MSFDHNSNVNTTIVLGVADPEMGAIETLAREAGWAVLYAAAPARDGQLVRVLSGGAYQATALIDAVGAVIEADPLDDTYLIECGGPAFESFEMVARCDHHNFGDWGYGRPPVEFLAASSLGQVIGTLAREDVIPLSWQHGMITSSRVGLPVGWIYQREVDLGAELGEWAAGYNVSGIRTVAEVVLRGGVFARLPHDLILAAAADHCLGAAYAGQCPGVDPAELRDHRRREKAAWLAGLPPTHPARREVEACAPGQSIREAIDIACDRTTAALLAAPILVLRGRTGHCGDPSRCGCGEGSYGSGDPGASTAYGSGDCDCEEGGCCIEQPIVEVRDVRGLGVLPLLPDVASELGVAVLYRMPPAPSARDQRTKVGILGAGEGTLPGRAPVAAFLGGWAEAQGLTDLYGDPARGYAGGYEPE